MTPYDPVIQHLVDWNDTNFGFTDENSDISPYVTEFDFEYGMGISSDDLSITLLSGGLRLYKDIDEIIGRNVYRPHRYRCVIDGNIALECFVEPPKEDKVEFRSNLQDSFKRDFQIGYVDQVTDNKIWHDVLAQLSIPVEQSFFNEYTLNDFINFRSTLQKFVDEFAIFGGGYAVESKRGGLSFVAARAVQDRVPNIVLDYRNMPVFEHDVYGASGYVANIISTDAVQQTSIPNATIGTQTVTLDAFGSSDGVFRTSPSTLVKNWSLSVQAGINGVTIETDNETLFAVNYTVVNDTDNAQTFTITATVRFIPSIGSFRLVTNAQDRLRNLARVYLTIFLPGLRTVRRFMMN